MINGLQRFLKLIGINPSANNEPEAFSPAQQIEAFKTIIAKITESKRIANRNSVTPQENWMPVEGSKNLFILEVKGLSHYEDGANGRPDEGKPIYELKRMLFSINPSEGGLQVGFMNLADFVDTTFSAERRDIAVGSHAFHEHMLYHSAFVEIPMGTLREAIKEPGILNNLTLHVGAGAKTHRDSGPDDPAMIYAHDGKTFGKGGLGPRLYWNLTASMFDRGGCKPFQIEPPVSLKHAIAAFGDTIKTGFEMAAADYARRNPAPIQPALTGRVRSSRIEASRANR